ncbi:Uncharacterised protein [Streptococcus oralis]|uniref:Uncharacterized protein n=1 Tax=Streptococcus oralis TaxID=1303 RepID=A0A4V0EBG2_STROR|nr:Uncharacterised protein [Streptococcus oralis]
MNKKEREKQFEEVNGRKRSESKSAPNKNIKIYIGLALAASVTLILVSIFSHSLIRKSQIKHRLPFQLQSQQVNRLQTKEK